VSASAIAPLKSTTPPKIIPNFPKELFPRALRFVFFIIFIKGLSAIHPRLICFLKRETSPQKNLRQFALAKTFAFARQTPPSDSLENIFSIRQQFTSSTAACQIKFNNFYKLN